jgi:hypothetical protein
MQSGCSEGQDKDGCPGNQSDPGRDANDGRPVAHHHPVLPTSSQGNGHESMVGPNHRRGYPIDLSLPRWMVATADVEQRGPRRPNPYGQGIVPIPLDCSRAGAACLPHYQHRLLDDCGLGRVECGRPQDRDSADGIRLDLDLGNHGGAGHCSVVDVHCYPLVRAEEAEPRQVDLAWQ